MSFVLGLTGGIGAGKSTAADFFRRRGLPVVDADAISRGLTAPGGEAVPEIRAAFGDAFITPEGALDRAAMRELVFSDPAARARLEAILHPMIGRAVERALREAGERSPVVVFDCPLLVESARWRALADALLVIDLCAEEQVRRVGLRSGLAPERVRSIIRAQASRKARLDAADLIVYNGGTPEALEENLGRLLSFLKKSPALQEKA